MTAVDSLLHGGSGSSPSPYPFLPASVQSLAELNRVVDPSGRVAVSVCQRPDELRSMQVFGGAIRRLLPDYPPDHHHHADPRSSPSTSSVSSRISAGLTEVEIHTVTEDCELESPGWLRYRFADASAVPKAVLGRFPGRCPRTDLDEGTASLRETYGQGPPSVPNEAHLALGRSSGRSSVRRARQGAPARFDPVWWPM